MTFPILYYGVSHYFMLGRVSFFILLGGLAVFYYGTNNNVKLLEAISVIMMIIGVVGIAVRIRNHSGSKWLSRL